MFIPHYVFLLYSMGYYYLSLHIIKFVFILETTDSKSFIVTEAVNLDEAIEKVGKLICAIFTNFTFII